MPRGHSAPKKIRIDRNILIKSPDSEYEHHIRYNEPASIPPLLIYTAYRIVIE